MSVEKEILLLLEEIETGVAELQADLDECLAIAKDTTTILASRPRPLQSL